MSEITHPEDRVPETHGRQAFTLFPRLPLELRRKIWRDALPESRVVQIHAEGNLRSLFVGASESQVHWRVSSNCRPAIALSVCHESHDHAQSIYKPLFLTNCSQIILTLSGILGDQRARIDWERDVLLYGPLIQFQKLNVWANVSKIRHLALDVGRIFSSVTEGGFSEVEQAMWNSDLKSFILPDMLSGLRSVKLLLGEAFQRQPGINKDNTYIQHRMFDIDSNFADLVYYFDQSNTRYHRHSQDTRSIVPLLKIIRDAATIKTWHQEYVEGEHGKHLENVSFSVGFSAGGYGSPKEDSAPCWKVVYRVGVADQALWPEDIAPELLVNGVYTPWVSRVIADNDGILHSRYDGMKRLFQEEARD